jgi:hypothetical protein
MEVNGPEGNADFDFEVPANAGGSVTYSVQQCTYDVVNGSTCDSWIPIPQALPAADTSFDPPGAQFCDWYASQAVLQADQGVKCGFSGGRWHTNKKAHFDWCMGTKGQSPGWSEYYSREGQLKDCLKKEVGNQPPKMNQSAGAPDVTVPQEVDLYADPGGAGQPIGTVKAGTRVQLYEQRPDQWCRINGHDMPQGGWVWCGEGFELK